MSFPEGYTFYDSTPKEKESIELNEGEKIEGVNVLEFAQYLFSQTFGEMDEFTIDSLIPFSYAMEENKFLEKSLLESLVHRLEEIGIVSSNGGQIKWIKNPYGLKKYPKPDLVDKVYDDFLLRNKKKQPRVTKGDKKFIKVIIDQHGNTERVDAVDTPQVTELDKKKLPKKNTQNNH